VAEEELVVTGILAFEIREIGYIEATLYLTRKGEAIMHTIYTFVNKIFSYFGIACRIFKKLHAGRRAPQI
jgi:hypothetical protein